MINCSAFQRKNAGKKRKVEVDFFDRSQDGRSERSHSLGGTDRFVGVRVQILDPAMATVPIRDFEPSQSRFSSFCMPNRSGTAENLGLDVFTIGSSDDQKADAVRARSL